MFTNRISGYFEMAEQSRHVPKAAFVAVPMHMAGCSRPFAAGAHDLYRLAYETAKAELHNRLVALLRSRWDLIHLS